MADEQEPRGLHPVPGSASGRGRIGVGWGELTSTVLDRPTRRRAGVFRRALRREASRLRDPRRIAAIVLLSLTFSILLAGMIGRGEPAGADARAYWAGVRLWINGGNPYCRADRSCPTSTRRGCCRCSRRGRSCRGTWRGSSGAGRRSSLLLWTIHWAYSRRPLTTALIVAVLAFPFGANLDTGNINLLLTLMLWAAQFTGPRLGGLLWALATWMKWAPAVVWFILAPRTRLWGLIWLGVSVLLSLVTLPLTIIQLQALFGFGARPVRLDYLVFLWAVRPVAVPPPGSVPLAAPVVVAARVVAVAARRRPAGQGVPGAAGIAAAARRPLRRLDDRPERHDRQQVEHDARHQRDARPRRRRPDRRCRPCPR